MRGKMPKYLEFSSGTERPAAPVGQHGIPAFGGAAKKIENFSGKSMPLWYIPAPLNDEMNGQIPVSGRNCIKL
jgi:hypothetical protein